MPIVRGVNVEDSHLKMVLKTGSTGPAVSDLQDLLKSHGFTQVGPTDGEFGPATKRALLQFQQSHNLDVDGLAGPNVWMALTAKTLPASNDADTTIVGSARAVELLSIASAEIGTREEPDGSNGGPRVDVYTGRWRVSWCALWASWVLKQTSWNPWKKPIAAVVRIRDWALDVKLYESSEAYEPRPGDLFIMLTKGAEGVDTGHGHVGIVLSYDKDKREIRTIEGNASNAVRSLKRPRSAIAGFVRITDV
jgi:hypothetical protein